MPHRPDHAVARLASAVVGAVVLATGCAAQAAPADGVGFREMRSSGRIYQVVRVDLTRADVRMYWHDEAGQPFGSLGALDRWLRGRGQHLLAATNAGIFYRTREPAGLHVERGAPPLRPLNTSPTPPPGEAQGNFFSQPNGVFYISRAGTAHVEETGAAARALPRMLEATQSGPLLLLRGVPHPLRGDTSVSRNAVAVCAARQVALVFAPRGASIRELALFIRDELGCPDALYLDGSISGLWVPAAGVRSDGSYVGILGVTPRTTRRRP
ncbi:MAG TPA: phosphodiester glycosidase family protein [Longimicrobiaceae bacterium]|nr:phosphodiester glycosidase family protein [Longimicrobiaceae bacterium]